MMRTSSRLAAVLVGALLASVWAAEPSASDIEALVKQLAAPRFRDRELAMQKLIKIGKPAVPALRAALASDDLEVQMRARNALKAIQTSLDNLIDDLKHGKPDARRAAAAALGELGPQAKAAIPTLVQLLKDRDESVREAAASALAGIDPENKALAGLIPAKAHVNGKYAKLLRKIHVPQDRQGYGDFSDWGQYQATDWQGHRNIPAGFWVYVYPHWYIWGEMKGVPGAVVPGLERPLTK